MGLGIDFNPAAAATYRPPREPKPRQIVKQPKPLRVEESRLPATEVKVKEGVPRALKEDEATQRANVAKVSRPLPQVQWVIPGVDDNDGKAHFAPASVGTQNEAEVDAGFEAARAEALERYEKHMEDSNERHESALVKGIAKERADSRALATYKKESRDAARAKVGAQVKAHNDIQRAAARAERERQRAEEAAEREEARRYDMWQAELNRRADVSRNANVARRSGQGPSRLGSAPPRGGAREPSHGPPRFSSPPATPARGAARGSRASPPSSAGASASAATPSESPEFVPPAPPGFEHVKLIANDLVKLGGYPASHAIALAKQGITIKKGSDNRTLYAQHGHKISAAKVSSLLQPPTYARQRDSGSDSDGGAPSGISRGDPLRRRR